MTKRFVAAVAIVFAVLSVASAQEVCRQVGSSDTTTVIGGSVGALIGSTLGDGRGQTFAIGAGGVLGGLVGKSLSPRRPSVRHLHSLARHLRDQRNQVIDAAVSVRIPMPRKAGPVRHQQEPAPASRRGLALCQKIEPGIFACRDSAGAWHIVR